MWHLQKQQGNEKVSIRVAQQCVQTMHLTLHIGINKMKNVDCAQFIGRFAAGLQPTAKEDFNHNNTRREVRTQSYGFSVCALL